MPPANPRASPEARALLAHLHALRGRTTLLAQHDYLTSGTRYFDTVTALTGRPPSIFGGDFSFDYHGAHPDSIGHCGPANLTEPGHGITWTYAPEKIFAPESPAQFQPADLHRQRLDLVARCIRLHQAGTLITLMWHGPTPACGHRAGDLDLWHQGSFSEASWQELLTPGTPLHQHWQTQVDALVPCLRPLADARVPVLWRPYHEMNGGWFWWGRRTTPGYGFARLWRHLYERLTHVHGLHNLLWVWNANAPRDTPGDEAGPYADYYPGGDVVDILATDIYHADYRDSHADDLRTLADGRPIALGEVGHLPPLDYLERHPDWSWIMPWGGLLFRFNRPETLQSLSRHLTR
jgi:mannan endo-1,4-beta-mannosidase